MKQIILYDGELHSLEKFVKFLNSYELNWINEFGSDYLRKMALLIKIFLDD